MKKEIEKVVSNYTLTELGKNRLNLKNDTEHLKECITLYKELKKLPDDKKAQYLYDNDIALEDEDIKLCINDFTEWLNQSLAALAGIGFFTSKKVQPVEIGFLLSETSAMYADLFNGTELDEGDQLLDELEAYIKEEYQSHIVYKQQKFYISEDKYKLMDVAMIDEAGQKELMRNKIKILRAVLSGQ